MPDPRVLAWGSDVSGAVGSEYIMLEKGFWGVQYSIVSLKETNFLIVYDYYVGGTLQLGILLSTLYFYKSGGLSSLFLLNLIR
jgi:hypothetical protein